MLSLRELEAFAGAFATVFFAFFHAAVAGEVAGVAKLLGHAPRSRTGGDFALGWSASGFRRGAFRGQAEHGFQGTGHPLANSAGLPREASAMDFDDHVETIAHLRQLQWPNDGGSILDFGEIIFQTAAINLNHAAAFAQPDASYGCLAPAPAEVISLLLCCLGFRHNIPF